MAEESTLARLEGAAFQEDIPRILRNDMTDLTKEAAKYRWLQALLNERGMSAAAEALGSVVSHLVVARTKLHETSGLLMQGVTDAMTTSSGESDDVHEEVDPKRNEPLNEVDCDGKVTLLSTVLIRARLASSTGRAKQLIRAGEVSVDGKQVSNTAQMIEPGSYKIRCGEIEQQLAVR